MRLVTCSCSLSTRIVNGVAGGDVVSVTLKLHGEGHPPITYETVAFVAWDVAVVLLYARVTE